MSHSSTRQRLPELIEAQIDARPWAQSTNHTDLLAAAPNVAAFETRRESRPAWRKVLGEHQERLAA